MPKDNVIALKKPETFVDDPITDILRNGARHLFLERGDNPMVSCQVKNKSLQYQ